MSGLPLDDCKPEIVGQRTFAKEREPEVGRLDADRMTQFRPIRAIPEATAATVRQSSARADEKLIGRRAVQHSAPCDSRLQSNAPAQFALLQDDSVLPTPHLQALLPSSQ